MASYHLSVKSGKPGKAANHAAYITRQGKHSQNEASSDLIYTVHGNLPNWTYNEAPKFWKAADKHERVNGATYREFEFALPVELSIEQNKEVVHEFISKVIGDKPYQAAIHGPIAALGTVMQTHAHVMCSDRIPDGFERSEERHFKRYNPADPELGGCRKASGGKQSHQLKSELIDLRETVATLLNNHLEKNGHSARVDHRSHLDRGITKEPERHLGQARIKMMSPEYKALFQQGRESSQGA